MDNKRIKGLVLDFDGTMCLLFQNFSLLQVSKTMSYAMKKYNIDFPEKEDAFNVFEYIQLQTQLDFIRQQALICADSILSKAELDAIDSCVPVAYLNEFLSFCKNRSVPIGIATNNSASCVKKFMKKYCDNAFVHIVGRVAEEPSKMKPNPWSISEVSRNLCIPPHELLLIGDSKRDYFASQKIGCNFLGMAPTEKKYNRLCKLIPQKDIISNFNELVSILSDVFE